MKLPVASSRDLPPGKMKGIESNNKSLLVANFSGTFYAIGNICTHMGCKLSEGTLDGVNVRCSCHGSTFDIRTGAVVVGPAEIPEPIYKLIVDGDKILASV